MKRQRSRSRGGSSSGGGNKPQQNANRAFDSNGPDGVKVRGHAQTVFEKYQQLARDATSAGDRVLAENHLQHAEHYFRVLRAVQPNRPVTEIMGRDAFSSGLDIDFEDESLNQPAPEAPELETAQGGEPRFEPRPDQTREPRPDYNRDGRTDYNREPRRDYSRERGGGEPSRYEARGDQTRIEPSRTEQPRNEQPRSDRPDYRRDDRPREDRARTDRYEGRSDYNRDDRPRDDRARTGRYEPRPERNGERAPDLAGDPLQVVRPEATPLTVSEPAGGVLRGQDGAVSQAPAFLQGRGDPAPADAAQAAAPKRPRTRRKPDAAAPAPVSEDV